MGKHVVKNKEISRLYKRLAGLPFVHSTSTCVIVPGAASGKPRIEYKHDSAEPELRRVPVTIKAGGCAQKVYVTLRVGEDETFEAKLRQLLAQPELVTN
jgi:hypothetical protein